MKINWLLLSASKDRYSYKCIYTYYIYSKDLLPNYVRHLKSPATLQLHTKKFMNENCSEDHIAVTSVSSHLGGRVGVDEMPQRVDGDDNE